MSAKQLAEIPESYHKHRVLKAADYERVDSDWSTVFTFGDYEDLRYTAYKDGSAAGFVYMNPDIGSRFISVDEIKPLDFWPAGTPTGEALRAYLRRWGWKPLKERQAGHEQANTKTII